MPEPDPEAGAPAPPPRSSAPGHWTSVPKWERPKAPTFEPVVAREIRWLELSLSRAGGGMMLLPGNDFDIVCPGIAVGEAAAATDLELMEQNGFTHVLNTCEGDDSYHVETGPHYYGSLAEYDGFPADDRQDYDISKHFDSAVQFIGKVVEPNPKYTAGASNDVAPVVPIGRNKVMVHCKAGASRSASAVLAYLVNIGMPLHEAFNYVRRGREIAPNTGFIGRLIVYDRELRAARDPEALAAADRATDIAVGSTVAALATIGIEDQWAIDVVFEAARSAQDAAELDRILKRRLGHQGITVPEDTVAKLHEAARHVQCG